MHKLLQSLGNKPRKGDVIDCGHCGEEFYRRPAEIKKGRRYCSTPCSNKGQIKGLPSICETCGEEFYRPVSQQKHRGKARYCSKPCKGKAMTKRQRGEANPAWRGGVSHPNRRIRASKAFREWREKVFERDDYTCQMCGVRGGYLEPDHIKPFAYFPELRFELSNGRTLCQPCHRTTDTFGYKAKINYGDEADAS